MENYLDEMVAYIKQHPVSLSTNVTSGRDGRVDSTINEDEVIAHLQKNPEFNRVIKTPKARSFYDFSINDNGKTIYINVKVSDFSNNAADNCSSKEGLLYALTGISESQKDYKTYHNTLIHNIKPGFDYYFLVQNKIDHSDSYWTSLKRITTLVPNGNNPPFQCNWAINRVPSGRTEKEATRYLLKTYLTSWEKRVSNFPFDLRDLLNSGNDLF